MRWYLAAGWLSERMGPRYDDDNYLSCVYEDNRIMPIRCRRVSVCWSFVGRSSSCHFSQSVSVGGCVLSGGHVKSRMAASKLMPRVGGGCTMMIR